MLALQLADTKSYEGKLLTSTPCRPTEAMTAMMLYRCGIIASTSSYLIESLTHWALGRWALVTQPPYHYANWLIFYHGMSYFIL